MKSGMLAAEAAFNAMVKAPAGSRAPLDLSAYGTSLRNSWASRRPLPLLQLRGRASGSTRHGAGDVDDQHNTLG